VKRVTSHGPRDNRWSWRGKRRRRERILVTLLDERRKTGNTSLPDFGLTMECAVAWRGQTRRAERRDETNKTLTMPRSMCISHGPWSAWRSESRARIGKRQRDRSTKGSPGITCSHFTHRPVPRSSRVSLFRKAETFQSAQAQASRR